MIRGAATLSLFIWVSPFLVSAQPAPSSPSPPPVPNHDRIDQQFRIRNPGPFPLPARYPIGKSAVAVDGLEDAIDRCMNDAMAAHSTPGASVAVAHDGQVMYHQGYGVKHRSEGGAVDPSTYFRVGSVTKQFTAAAVMQQVERGLVFLDDPVTVYVPEVEIGGIYPASRITVHHLLTHSSGFPDLVFNPEGPTNVGALGDWAANLEDVVLHAPPGVFFNYSNPNFNLAGLVVERTSGMPYRDYMYEQVFGPAGLSRTTFDPAVVMADGNYTFGHDLFPGGTEIIYAPDDYDNGVFTPAGYAFSTAGDLVQWALSLMEGGGDVLSPTSCELMQTPHVDLNLLPGQGYGYGVFTEPFGDLTIHQHSGSIWGWGAFLLWEPNDEFAVAVLANTFGGIPEAAYCIADAVLQPGPWPPIEDPTNPADWHRYEIEWDFTLRNSYPVMGFVSVVDEDELRLVVWDPESPYNEFFDLIHVGYNVFLADLDLDGEPESDFTFLNSGDPERPKWLRARIAVGSPHTRPLNPAGRRP